MGKHKFGLANHKTITFKEYTLFLSEYAGKIPITASALNNQEVCRFDFSIITNNDSKLFNHARNWFESIPEGAYIEDWTTWRTGRESGKLVETPFKPKNGKTRHLFSYTSSVSDIWEKHGEDTMYKSTSKDFQKNLPTNGFFYISITMI